MTLTQQHLKPIETQYAGCRFRSRLEARWAVAFDHLGIRWEYEAEGYETPAGRYLPDFVLHLPSGPHLFEVKPESQLEEIDERWYRASEAADAPLIVAYGIPRPDRLEPGMQPGNGHLNYVRGGAEGEDSWDNYYAFCLCCVCGAVGIEFDGRGARVCPDCNCTHGNRDKCYSYDAGIVVDAFISARSARFEHGERG